MWYSIILFMTTGRYPIHVGNVILVDKIRTSIEHTRLCAGLPKKVFLEKNLSSYCIHYNNIFNIDNIYDNIWISYYYYLYNMLIDYPEKMYSENIMYENVYICFINAKTTSSHHK